MLKEGQYKAVYGDFYGSPKEIWGFRYATKPGRPRERAEQFLREHAALLRLKPSLADLEGRRPRESLRATHVEFEQKIYGEGVHRGVISVHMDRRGAVYLVRNRTTPESLQPEGPSFELDPKRAVQIARSAIADRKKGRVKNESVVKLWYPVRDYLAPALRVRLSRRHPAELWDVIIHAVTEEVLWKYDNVAFARATIFDPSPVAKLGSHDALIIKKKNPKKPGIKDPPKDSYYYDVPLAGLGRSGFLRSKRVIVESATFPHRVKRTSGMFAFRADDERFEHVMAYHHLDRAVRYVEELGYRGAKRLFRKPLRVDPRAFREDNAYYDPATRSLAFGTGDIDEAEDGETLLHEFGHAIQDAICPEFGLSVEGAAMGEGFGDYFAASFFASRKPKKYQATAMAWDGIRIGFEEGREPPCMRKLDEELTYDDFKPRGDEHENGEIWAATLWDVRRVLNQTRSGHTMRADRTIIESHFQLDPHASFARAARAIIDANDNLNRGENRRALENVFKRRAIDLDGT